MKNRIRCIVSKFTLSIAGAVVLLLVLQYLSYIEYTIRIGEQIEYNSELFREQNNGLYVTSNVTYNRNTVLVNYIAEEADKEIEVPYDNIVLIKGVSESHISESGESPYLLIDVSKGFESGVISYDRILISTVALILIVLVYINDSKLFVRSKAVKIINISIISIALAVKIFETVLIIITFGEHIIAIYRG